MTCEGGCCRPLRMLRKHLTQVSALFSVFVDARGVRDGVHGAVLKKKIEKKEIASLLSANVQ